jgi:hypothetical protein
MIKNVSNMEKCQPVSLLHDQFVLKNINSGAHFLLLTYFESINFRSLYFLKWCPICDTSPLTQFSKFNNFFWVCWFLGKNLSNFVPPVWKLHNPYCHSAGATVWPSGLAAEIYFFNLAMFDLTWIWDEI